MKTHFAIESYLQEILEFQRKIPGSHVGGSIGLFLHGIDLKRSLGQSDIDMTIPDYLPDGFMNESKYEQSSSPGDFDGQIRCNISDSLYIKMEIRVSPEPSFDIINFKDQNYRVSKKQNIIFWKTKYARNGVQKHIDDLIVIDGGDRPKIAFNQAVVEDDGLPF